MTVDARQALTREQFTGSVLGPVRSLEPRNIAVQHTYLIHVVGTVPPGQRVVCGDDGANPQESARMDVASAPEQAYVVLTGDSTQDTVTFTLWLVRQSDWRVNSFSAALSTVAGKNASQLWTMAREEHARSHEFNATVLYASAMQAASRGRHLELAVVPQIMQEQARVEVPDELTGAPPFKWHAGAKTFVIESIGATAAFGKLYLGLSHASQSRSEKQARRANEELITWLLRRFPECSQAFPGIIARTVDASTNRSVVNLRDLAGAAEGANSK
jgi:hypothetical protein